jgi:hypothetical protein
MERWIIIVRKILILLFIGFFIGAFSVTSAYAQNEITILFNGEAVQFDQPPILSNGRVIAPSTTIANTLNAHLYWNNTEQNICFYNTKNGRHYFIEIGEASYHIEGEGAESIRIGDQPPIIIDASVFIPVRFFAERSGFDVDWDEDTMTVFITKPKYKLGSTAVITYLNNEGIGNAPPPQIFALGQTVKLADLDHPRDVYKLDHTFDGWTDSATGKLYSVRETVQFDSNVILCATFTCIFDNKTIW